MNKTLKLYGIIFIVVMLILALLEVNKTAVTDWRKDFDPDKKSPFGLFVFSGEAQQLLKGKLEKSGANPYEYYENYSGDVHNILLIQQRVDYESWQQILTRVEEGSDAMIISNFIHPDIEEELELSIQDAPVLDSLTLKLTDIKLNRDSLIIDKLPSHQVFTTVEKSTGILGYNTSPEGRVNFIRIKKGKGNLYLHTEPLFVTNYYLLKPGNEKYAADVFSYLPDRKTVWFMGEGKAAAKSASPLRFILSQPALKYAWWLFLGGLLLFVVFTARRRQRVVPIVEPLKNNSVEFVKSIGNLYLQEGEILDMMAKKGQYFLYRVRTELLIDTQELDDVFAGKLQQKTGKDLREIQQAVKFIKRSQNPYTHVTREDLIRMNKVLDHILR